MLRRNNKVGRNLCYRKIEKRVKFVLRRFQNGIDWCRLGLWPGILGVYPWDVSPYGTGGRVRQGTRLGPRKRGQRTNQVRLGLLFLGWLIAEWLRGPPLEAMCQRTVPDRRKGGETRRLG